MAEAIDRETLKAKLDRGDDFVLIDTLPRAAYDKHHIPGAIHVVSDDIREKVPELVADKDREIVVYCGSTQCQRSAKAAARLDDMGYRRVYEYVEGRQDWQAAGYPVEGSEAE